MARSLGNDRAAHIAVLILDELSLDEFARLKAALRAPATVNTDDIVQNDLVERGLLRLDNGALVVTVSGHRAYLKALAASFD